MIIYSAEQTHISKLEDVCLCGGVWPVCSARLFISNRLCHRCSLRVLNVAAGTCSWLLVQAAHLMCFLMIIIIHADMILVIKIKASPHDRGVQNAARGTSHKSLN